MNDIIAGKTALAFYRVPPRLRKSYPPLPLGTDVGTRRALSKTPIVAELLSSPLFFMVTGEADRTCEANIKQLLWTGPLPVGAVRDDNVVNQITSPEMTLFMLAREVPTSQLALLMYEFCGRYAVYEPRGAAREKLERIDATRGLQSDGWQRVSDSNGRPSDLWQRDPLTTVDKLWDFAAVTKGAYCHKKFEAALRMVAGEAYSPFEAKAAMLLAAPRCLGGQGLEISMNEDIAFNEDAQLLALIHYATADILIRNQKTGRLIDVECQGDMIHKGDFAAAKDADRMTALQSMGVEVITLSYQQISNYDRFHTFLGHLCNVADIELRDKSEAFVKKERQLRKELFDVPDV